MKSSIRWLVVSAALILNACEMPGQRGAAERLGEHVDDRRLIGADRDPGNWLSHGKNYAEDRFSSLQQINAQNVHTLGLAWSYELGTDRGVEATPLVIDGVLFATGPWSVVYAFDVRKGVLLWAYDPQVPRRYGDIACCDVVNRGVAFYKGRVYVGTFDGRLVSLDAVSGAIVWEVLTVDQSKPYSITGAPRIVDGKVIIGNGGAEFGVRGYVSAYDASTGELVWRTFTVPGDPAQPFESRALERAAKTWTGTWWQMGGGGTAWDSMAYDPDLNLLYVGTGNGAPWDRRHRSPEGGDNLYLASILALDPADGTLVWHYQTTPGDTWDFTATQHLILADLEIAGRPRKVIMQAPKNGFFYVLDRQTGQLISAEPYVPVNWAERVDAASGRPIEKPGSDYRAVVFAGNPGVLGAHNWQPMAYSPATGLVYIPAQSMPWEYEHDAEFSFVEGQWNAGVRARLLPDANGQLIAWDPVAQKEVWRVPYIAPWNGGVLATAGNLVFQGTADGRFVAYDSRDGRKLWQAPTGTGVLAAPVTYVVDGKQYVTVMAGWGGAWGQRHRAEGTKNALDDPGRIYTFVLGGDAPSPVGRDRQLANRNDRPHVPEQWSTSPPALAKGDALFHQHCSRCHGTNAVSAVLGVPDLRYSTLADEIYLSTVLSGARAGLGMPGFAERISEQDASHIRSYVISQAALALHATRTQSAGASQ